MTASADDVAGLVAVVTGAGRGIGRVIARALAAGGAHVVLAARSADQIEQVAGEIATAGGSALAVPTDVADEASIDALVAAAVDRWGRLDVMVNNAGVIHHGSLASTTVEQFDHVLTTNVRGTFLGTRAALKAMDRGGSIVNMASTFGNKAVRGYGAYCASKAAILQLTRVAALEGARAGIRVNAVAPGYVATDFNADALADPSIRASIEKRVPLGRVTTSEELLPLTLYLCSAASAYCTGSVFTIDGGFAL